MVLGTDKDSPLQIGVGFIGWILEQDEETARKALELTLDKGVRVIWFAFGNDLYKWIKFVRKYDSDHDRKTLIFTQLALPDDIQTAIHDWKVDAIVAQGYLT
jgi:nitronate monooxygenase